MGGRVCGGSELPCSSHLPGATCIDSCWTLFFKCTISQFGCGSVAEPPNLMSPRSTYLPLDTKYSREDIKLRSSVEHTLRENSKFYIFPSGS